MDKGAERQYLISQPKKNSKTSLELGRNYLNLAKTEGQHFQASMVSLSFFSSGFPNLVSWKGEVRR